MTCTHSKQGRARGQRARAANKGKGVAHRLVVNDGLAEDQYSHIAQDGHEQLGLVFDSGVALIFMGPSNHTQAKVGCAGLLHAAVCSSAPQCLEPLPPPPIVQLAPQDHPVHLLAVTWHDCARSEQKHESAQVLCVGPLCAVASCSAARALPIYPPLCCCCAISEI